MTHRSPSLSLSVFLVFGAQLGAQSSQAPMTSPSAIAIPDPRGRPGEEHKILDAYVGDWDLVMKLWFSPGEEPVIATGTSHVEWVLGGRFTEERVKATLLDRPYEALSITGYNAAAKRYEATRYSGLNTATLPEHGTFDPATRTLTFLSLLQQADGATTLEQRTSTTQKHLDQHVWEVFHKGPDGKERKAIELVYTRRR